MSELNLNTIITTAFTTILNDYTKPMVERITALEGQVDEDAARIAVLEERVTRQVTLIVELTNRLAEHTQEQGEQSTTADYSNYPHGDGQRMEDMIAKAVHDAIEAHIEISPHHGVAHIEEIVDDKISDHCNDYDHDEFITEVDEDAVRDAVSDCLRDATVRLG